MFAVLAVIVSLAPGSSAGEESRDSAEQFIENWADTFNRNAPKEQLMFYNQSEETEVIVSAGVRHRGYQAVRKAYTDDQRELRYYDSEAQDISTRILGETAVITFEHRFKIRLTEERSRWQVHIRTTSVLHRIEGQWKIVQEHSSPIRDIDRMTPIEQ